MPKKPAKTLWIGGYGPEESSHGRGLATFRDRVETDTGGEMKVRVTWNVMDEGRPNTDLLEMVEAGEMFFCYFSSSYLGHRVPALEVLETPYLFSDLEHAHRALDGALGMRLGAEVRDKTGFEVLGFWDNGFRHLTNRLRPVSRPADCAGLRVRLQPNAVHEDLIRCWGGEPVPANLNDGIRLIQSGEVDAQENPLANTMAYGVGSVHKHITMTAHLYGARGLWAHRETLESLPAEMGGIVRRAAAEAIKVQRDEAARLEQVYRTEMESDGIEFVDLDQAQQEQFREVSEPAITRARDGLPSDLYDLVTV